MPPSYGRAVAAGFVIFVLTFSPYAHAAEATALTINDPFVDAFQLWSTVLTAIDSFAIQIAAALAPHQTLSAGNPQNRHASKNITQTAPAAAFSGETPASATDTAATANATTTIVKNYITEPVIEREVQTADLASPTYVTQSELNAQLNQLSNSLIAEFNSPPPSVPQYVAAGGSGENPLAASNAINNLSDVTISNSTIDSASIPDLSGSYLSLKGGTVTGALVNSSTASSTFAGALGIGTTSPSDTFALNGAAYLADITAPANTANRLYSNSGSLYWAGNLVSGAAVGNWTSDGTNVWRTGGKVGIGNPSPSYALDVTGAGHFTSYIDASYFTATSSIATSLFNGNLTVNGNTTLANATSTNLAITGTASTSALVASNSFTFRNVTGFLKATAGAVSTSLINLAGDVTGILPVGNGGTGWANVAAGAIPYGNGSSALATTTAGTAGYVLAYLNGVPTWTASSTLSNISGTLAAANGGTGSTTLSGLLVGNGTSALNTATLAGSLSLTGSTLSDAWTLSGSNLYNNAGTNVGIGTTSPGSILSIQGLANWTTATSTYYSTGGINLAAGCFAINGTCVGATSASSTLLSDNNTFSGNDIFANLLNLNGGLTAYASSTIGNGNQTGGLTINGGATTTGNVYVGPTSAQANPEGAPNFGIVQSGADIFSVQGNSSFSDVQVAAYRNSSATHALVEGLGARGTQSAPSAMQTGDDLLSIRAGGYGTTNFDTSLLDDAAAVQFQADGNFSDSGGLPTHPGRIVFDTAQGTGFDLERMRITSTGNVGIGTTSPATTLSTQGNEYTTGGLGVGLLNTSAGTIQSLGNILGGGTLALSGTSGTTTIASGQGFTVGNTQFVVQQGSGNVGIGTTNPGSLLDVNGFINANGTAGGYKIDGNLILQASTTIDSTLIGINQPTLAAAGTNNTSLGYNALRYATSTSNNTAIGWNALNGNSTNFSGYDNTALGAQALQSDTSGYTNTAVGFQALHLNTAGLQNTAIGNAALNMNTSGNQNTAVGYAALTANTTGGGNAALGQWSLQGNQTGNNNEGIGYQALNSATSSSNNIAIGYQAAESISGATGQVGGNNTLVGYRSGYDITTGSNNISLGYFPTTGVGITTGSNNIMIGQDVRPPSQTASNQLNICNLLYGTALGHGTTLSSGNVGIGTTTPDAKLTVSANSGDVYPDNNVFEIASSTASATTTLFSIANTGNAVLAGTLTQNSDERLKTNIQSLNASSSLAAIDALNPVTFDWVNGIFGVGDQLGFVAQDVQKLFPQLVSTTSPTAYTPNGTLGLNYSGLISPIVAAIRELDQQLTNLANTVAGFAQSITTHLLSADEVQTQQLCINSTCIDQQQLAALLASQGTLGQGSGSSQSAAVATSSAASATPPVLQLNGDNPAIIQVGTTYNDLGATITGPQQDLNLGLTTYVNGTQMSPIQIGTAEAATDTIDYVATDQNGLTSTSTRSVIIEAPANDNQATSTPANENSPPLNATTTSATSTATTTTQ
jgi:hypothetical protein